MKALSPLAPLLLVQGGVRVQSSEFGVTRVRVYESRERAERERVCLCCGFKAARGNALFDDGTQ